MTPKEPDMRERCGCWDRLCDKCQEDIIKDTLKSKRNLSLKELSETLYNTLAEVMGDDEFVKWNEGHQAQMRRKPSKR